ncbi:MAG TPA: restriction endonuclease [Desulfosporosinus sp.]|nr:restriction endonuclease [Desulfosporosinus sp.]
MDYQADITFQYPPDLFTLLIQTIPLLCRTKKDVISFFQGAGIGQSNLQDLIEQLEQNRQSINKYDLVRTVLTRVNQQGEQTLRERREILKRVVEFEDFSSCWPDDQLKAKGAIGEVRQIINVKDSFTRMRMEREAEKEKRQSEQKAKLLIQKEKKEKLEAIKKEFYALFAMTNPQKRGKLLEGVLNRFFDAEGILIREAFTLEGAQGEGVLEQIDGVIEIDGNLFLVEMKWWDTVLGVGEVAQHIVRVYSRGHARAIFISSSGFTGPAISECKEALRDKVIVLCKLEELVMLLEQGKDIREFLKEKIQAAIIHKNPMFEPLKS